MAKVLIESQELTWSAGERCWMQNPYFKDGTRVRNSPNPADEPRDCFILNDKEVELLDVSQIEDKGFVLVRSIVSEDTLEGEAVEGWVRASNISKIKRKAGLPELGEIAQLAVVELEHREDDIIELEAIVEDDEKEIANLKDEIARLKSEIAAHVAAEASDGAERPFTEGEHGYMLNPMFQDGTRLRSEPTQEAPFNDLYILNDAEVEILEVRDGFLKLREIPDADKPTTAEDGTPVEGWVRARNVTRVQRESGLTACKRLLRQSLSEDAVLQEISRKSDLRKSISRKSVTELAGVTEEGGEGTAEGGDAADAADPGLDAEELAEMGKHRANEIGQCIKVALEKSNMRLAELFHDWDKSSKGYLDKPDMVKALAQLGIVLPDIEVGAVFDFWDTDSSGTLEYKELDRAIRASKESRPGKDVHNRLSMSLAGAVSAKEIQRRLKERLQGRLTESRKPAKSENALLAKGKPVKGKKGKSDAALLAVEEEQTAYEEPEEPPEGTWSASKWLNSLGISKVITRALRIPSAKVKPAFDFVRSLSREEVGERLEEAKLEGLREVLDQGLSELRKQKVSGSSALNDKFQATGKFQMSYGSLSLFYGGLESLLGPPVMTKDSKDQDSRASLFKSMENDHCAGVDSNELFRTPNGMSAKSWQEWEFVVNPTLVNYEDLYAERDGLRETHPEWCRKPVNLQVLMDRMESEANSKLRRDGHSELIVEELVGGRLYTGPMYAKYNAVLRAMSRVPFLMGQAKELTKGNHYVTTIHAINSCVIKLSKLTKAGNVWRGIKDATLPPEFWVPNELGVRGGIEYGFSSTTTDKEQAIYYANVGAKAGDAMTIFEMRMGMVDRGADLSWLSQYPHEREVLLPPLTGVEALNSDVEGNMLVIQSRFSLNLSAQTLEQVLSRRRKMLMDMHKGIELDLRDALPDKRICDRALDILRKALEYGAFSFEPEWFNNDDNFAKVMQETLYLQRILVQEIEKLDKAMSKTELNMKGWKEMSAARMMLISGWVLVRHSLDKNVDISLDLRDTKLQPSEGVELAKLLKHLPKLTSLDVRSNETLGDEGVSALESFMKTQKVTSSTSVAHSLCGITPANSRLDIPKKMEPIELRIVCAELENSVWAEGVSAAMGAKSKGSSQLNRRGGSHQTGDTWKPLIWAAKENQLMLAEKLMDHGFSVNEQESTLDKALSGYVPLHHAANKGHKEMIELLLSRGATVTIKSKHGDLAKSLAEKKQHKEIVEVLEAAEKLQAKSSAAKTAEGSTAPKRRGSIAPK